MSKEDSSWMSRPEKGSSSAIKVMAWASFIFGRTVTRPVIYLIALFYLVFATSARRSSKKYLTLSLGRNPSIYDQFKHFLAFATVTHDRLYLLAGRYKYFQFSVSGESVIKEALRNGRGLMLYGAHFGSFEAVRYTAIGQHDLKIALLMHEANGRMFIELLKEISPEFSNAIIPLGSVTTMIEVKDRLEKGHMVGLLADRSVNEDQRNLVPFLGHPARFPQGPFKLQRLFKCPALFISGVYLGGNRYEIVFHDLMPSDASITTNKLQIKYVQELERMCLTYPYNWFNFYDFWEQA